MQLIFFGSDQYSAIVLNELLSTKSCQLSTIVTDPPKPQGRKQIITPNPVEQFAIDHHIPHIYYKESTLVSQCQNVTGQSHFVGLTASFPHLFPSEIIKLFQDQLYNLHPSLLPQYRNVAPVPYALAMGDQVTGITLFRIGSGVDSGEIVAQYEEPILATDSTPSLLTRLFTLGTDLFVKACAQNFATTAKLHNWKTEDMVFTRKISRQTSYVEWEVLQKLLSDQPIRAEDTSNPLINLRLSYHPDRTKNILKDLIRALEGYEKVWTVAPTKKGDIQISVLSPQDKSGYLIQIPGKPKPIALKQFLQVYF